MAITRGPSGRFRSRPGTRVPSRRPSAGSFTAGRGIIAPRARPATIATCRLFCGQGARMAPALRAGLYRPGRRSGPAGSRDLGCRYSAGAEPMALLRPAAGHVTGSRDLVLGGGRTHGSFTAGGGIIAPASLLASLNLRAVATTAPGPALRRPTGSRDLVLGGGRTGARCCRTVTKVPRRRSSALPAVTPSESVPGRERRRLSAQRPPLQQPLVLAATPREAKRGAPARRCCPGGA